MIKHFTSKRKNFVNNVIEKKNTIDLYKFNYSCFLDFIKVYD